MVRMFVHGSSGNVTSSSATTGELGDDTNMFSWTSVSVEGKRAFT